MLNIWTRKEYHEKKWKEIYWLDNCPFCTNLKEKNNTWEILRRWKYCFVIYNNYPYSGNNKHIMLIPYSHKKYYLELSDEEILDFKNANIFIKNFFNDDNYFSFLRETMANRSVEHLHYHYLIWKLQWKYLRKMLMDQGFPIVEDLNK